MSTFAPTPGQTLLLRTCLGDREASVAAWEAWSRSVDDPVAALGRHPGGARRLLPMLCAVQQACELPASKELLTYLRTALSRDELRYATFQRILGEVLRGLDAPGVPVVLLKGTVLAEQLYTPPSLRHTHDIDLLVRPDQLYEVAGALCAAGFSIAPHQLGTARQHLRLTHASGLAAVLHTNLFRLSHHAMDLDNVWERTEEASLQGHTVRVLNPPDALFHLCGHAATSESRYSLAWACDAGLLLRRHPDLDWEGMVDAARRVHLALPLVRSLTYLAEALALPVPKDVLARLRDAADEADAYDRAVASFAVQRGAWRKGFALLQTASPRVAGGLLRDTLLPPAEFLRQLYPGPAPIWCIPHMVRVLAALAARRFRRG